MQFKFNKNLTSLIVALVGAHAGAVMANEAPEQWPTRAVKIVVPFSAGSATDLISRQLAHSLSAKFKQSFIVDNKPGGSASIGSIAVANAPADGYTLLMSGPASMVTNKFTLKNLSYNPDTFEKVALVAYTPNVLLTNKDQPFKTLAELIQYAKTHPGELSYASFGAGTTSHIAGEMFKQMAGVDILHVPYKGAGDAIPALIAGHVSLYFDTIMTALPQVNAGKLVALGMSTDKRSDMAKDIPTIAEQKIPGYNIAPWYGIAAPGGTPKLIVGKLNAAINEALKNAEFNKKLQGTGAEPMGGSVQDFEQFIAKETPRTETIVKASGLTTK
ncbi:tripartite tricarboxylate transporter substrate binding protein [Diaphorobacter sp. HDW4A]|uniref:Bug family tripartite tricarboxylate transporter substrate binding protein n=1 Tax=Diaphorobacter sp. HDW4A TaxID=2714924 RepID=UPI00140D6DFC|nr:tripartite tricarboxylate transporter substrate binding protein [Diaphorobacter sp. HDW4A]QIL79282.1 tripartite tricarboxylate transporter substrate binding protein [Diaphorobacter sp. HDW4A]